MKRTDVPPRDAMLAAIRSDCFENAYALAVRGTDAKRLGLRTIDDLARVSPDMTLGADLEFLERPEWAMLRRAYPLRFAATRAYSPTFMFHAIESGQADAISAFSSDGRIAAMNLRVLEDPKAAIPGYDAILLAAPRRAGDARFVRALRPLVGAIAVETMRQANYQVDRTNDKQSPLAAARWLDARIRAR
jgi:osmoprotectant transport system permease protein